MNATSYMSLADSAVSVSLTGSVLCIGHNTVNKMLQKNCFVGTVTILCMYALLFTDFS